MTQILGVTIFPTQPRKQSWVWGPDLEPTPVCLPEPACTAALAVMMHVLWALPAPGYLCLNPGPTRAHSQEHPESLRTLPFSKGRLWPQQLFWQQTSSFSLKPCHRLGLERDYFSPTFFFPFSCEAPSAFQLVIAPVRLNGLAGKMTTFSFLSWSCLKFLQKYLSQGLRLVPKFIIQICHF